MYNYIYDNKFNLFELIRLYYKYYFISLSQYIYKMENNIILLCHSFTKLYFCTIFYCI